MYTVGFLATRMSGCQSYQKYLEERRWNVLTMDLSTIANKFTIEDVDAVIIWEETMEETCTWLINAVENIAVPIFVLSSNGNPSTNIVYLQLGAEACFSQKMLPEELYITLSNLLRNKYCMLEQTTANKESTPKKAGLELLPGNLSVVIEGQEEISLTKKEFQAMEILYNNPRKAISYEEFREKLWNQETNEDDKNYRIANVVFHLRNKLEQNESGLKFIKTIRSKGYMLDVK